MYDILACIPFAYFMGSDPQQKRLYKVIKLLRVPRLFALLDIDNVKKFVNNHYSKQLENAVKNNDNNFSFPIMKALM